MPVKKGICDVCRLVLRNYEYKTVTWCPKCNAWICINCQDKWFRRFKAMIISKLEKIFKEF